MILPGVSEERLVYERNDRQLIVMQRRSVKVCQDLIHQCEQELLESGNSVGGVRSGYLLGLEGNKLQRSPALTLIEGELREQLITPVEKELTLAFDFSFFKVCDGRSTPTSEGVSFEGPHLDAHPGLDENSELLRVLINLSPQPRRFLFAETDRLELKEMGVKLNRRGYEVLSVPVSIKTRVVEIPGRVGDYFSILRFWASAVPHVGVNEPCGYFLASYETLADSSMFLSGHLALQRCSFRDAG